jgi:hypothetical protein
MRFWSRWFRKQPAHTRLTIGRDVTSVEVQIAAAGQVPVVTVRLVGATAVEGLPPDLPFSLTTIGGGGSGGSARVEP